REVRALEPLLPHPVVAQVERRVVAGRAGADDHHPAGVAHEARGGHGVLAGMLEHDARAALLAQNVPDRLAEGARAAQPDLVVQLILPVGKHAPVVEVLAVDAAGRAELLAEVDLVVARDDRDRDAAERTDDLDGLTAETARAAPDQ